MTDNIAEIGDGRAGRLRVSWSFLAATAICVLMAAGCAESSTSEPSSSTPGGTAVTTTTYFQGQPLFTDIKIVDKNGNVVAAFNAQDHEGGPGNDKSGSQGSSSQSSSDIRLKRDLVEVGRLANGIHLYHFRYIWSDREYVGVVAQEAAKVVPGAVSRGADGYLRVDYAKLGLRLETWDEWLREHSGQASRAN
jgi:hypothetical protein